jgi:hypothetical protein
MKKVFIYTACLFTLLFGIISCDDNADYTGEHVLTQDEIDEIRRQDSIDSVMREKINADLILEYSVDVNISQTSHDGTNLNIDLDKIAEQFGITVEQLLAGIAGESGAPEVKGFAIEGSTHADNNVKTNTNGPWGHWWDSNGDVITYGDGAMVYAEFDAEVGRFHVGQYPAHLTKGQSIKFIEALKYNEIRVAVVITANATVPGEITASVVNTQKLSINVSPKSDYNADPLDFDLEQTMKDLGISSMDDIQFLGVNEDGSYAQEAVTGTGFWYDKNGFVGEYGDNASVYTTYGEFEDNQIGIGQMPNVLAEGESYTIKYAFMANNKIEMFEITINVVAYEDPETPPAGDPVTIEEDIIFTKSWDEEYISIQEDVKEALREAFKMTTYQIHKAISSGDLKVYLNEVTAEEPDYTSDVPGYWINVDGVASAWADGIVWCSIGHSETELYLYTGNHPENAVAGNVVSTKMIVTCNGGKAIFNITFNITAAK